MILLAVAGYLVVQYVTGGQGPGCKVVSGTGDGQAYEFTPEQAVNAATIAAVGTGRGMSERAVTIALATSIQESGLRNIEHGDRDSLGLFQQRPSQGWGTPAQLIDPVYATNAFLNAMIRDFPNGGWESGDIGAICQGVQNSAFPDRYAHEVHDAQLLVNALWAGSSGVSGVTSSTFFEPPRTAADAFASSARTRSKFFKVS